MNWYRNIKGKVKLQEPLKLHTSFRIGGAALYFIAPADIADLRQVLKAACKQKLPVSIIGSGSNILVSDKGKRGVVLSLSSPYFKKFSFAKGNLKAGSGVKLSQLILEAKKHSLSGLEYFVGIPGTVGGAVVMNAGIAKDNRSIGDIVESVEVIGYNGKIRNLNRKEIKFAYRFSSLAKYIVLSVIFKLVKANKKDLSATIKEILLQRKATQDYGHPSAGCIFKNPKGFSAGRLIDLCGLKGKRIGDACVSQKHANFIVNLGKAKAGDVLKLIQLVKNKVKSKFNIELELEILPW